MRRTQRRGSDRKWWFPRYIGAVPSLERRFAALGPKTAAVAQQITRMRNYIGRLQHSLFLHPSATRSVVLFGIAYVCVGAGGLGMLQWLAQAIAIVRPSRCTVKQLFIMCVHAGPFGYRIHGVKSDIAFFFYCHCTFAFTPRSLHHSRMWPRPERS